MVDVIIIGAGPAGLTAAYLLAKAGKQVVVLESDTRYVGGISRTVEYRGYRFDIGGHRFFSKSQEVEDFWTEILGEDMIERPRLSRIFYRGQFFSYPLKAVEALQKLGIIESTLCMLSYIQARLFPHPKPKNFEDWVSNQFGTRLFKMFFKTYTEKVWGMSCKEISADWAAQRIKGLSLSSAIKNALSGANQPIAGERSKVVKTLIASFRYPRLGPGMMWERCAEKMAAMGGTLEMGTRADRLHWDEGKACWNVHTITTEGQKETLVARHVISSMPMRELGVALCTEISKPAATAAQSLRYRDFITVALILRDHHNLDDNWIYVHDPGVKVGRVQNFKAWSPELVPKDGMTCYGLEYFCFEGDGLWSLPDAELIELAKRELVSIGLANPADIEDGSVVRQPKAYPVYDDDYTKHVDRIRADIADRFPNLHLVGRNGMHKYNNQDHSMMTAMLTVRNIIAGKSQYDVWNVNQDAEYHEEKKFESAASGLRAVPSRVEG
jgi:protoporphyrinogen oxidase